MSRIFYFHLFHSCIYISIVICGDGGIMTYTSYEGGSVNIRCPYDAQFINNTKYLCRGNCPTINLLAEKDKPIMTRRTPDDTRFSLNDNKTATTFTITDLRVKDGGQYWCAVQTPPYQLDVYREVFLSVKKMSRMFGVKGDELSVQCHSDHDVINNDKFLCKGEDLSLCETSGVKVSKKKIINGRFSLSDDASARGFTVTITHLTEEDSGIYWCGNALSGSQQEHDKWISAVILKISEEGTSHKPTTFSFYITHPASPDSSSTAATSSPSSLLTSSSSSAHSLSPNTDTSLCGFITTSVAVMLILLGFVLFIYFRRRKKNEQLQLNGVAHGSAENLKNGEIEQNRVSVCYYEEIPLTNVHPGYSLPTSGEHDASVYALAQNDSSNDLHYSTIELTDHPDRTSDGQTSSDYATVVL